MYSARDTSNLQPVLTVSQLTHHIRLLLEETFDQVAVVGEISNAKVYPSGHWYFSLKDKDATLPCVCFKSSNSQIKFALEDGIMVVVRGKLGVYPPRGAYQMVANSLEPVGVGDWQLAFQQLRQKLEAEGLLDAARKRPIPQFPKKVGVVTSLAGAALHDVLTALKRRNRGVKVVIRAARVQGEGSADEIAQGIKDLQEIEDLDVILVARGGGSIEDLWSFNTECVARAVAECKIPVVSGVGHETDLTICDLVADLRAPTPTAAAELVARGRLELQQHWSNLNRRMLQRMSELITRAQWSVQRLHPLNSLLRYKERLKQFDLRVRHLQARLIASISGRLVSASHRISASHQRLSALGPQNVLNRGFSILRKTDGKVVQSPEDVSVGDYLEAWLSKGKLKVRVEALEDEWY